MFEFPIDIDHRQLYKLLREHVNLLLDNVDIVQVRGEIAEGLVNVGARSLWRGH